MSTNLDAAAMREAADRREAEKVHPMPDRRRSRPSSARKALMKPSASIKWNTRNGKERFRDLVLGERMTFGNCACGPWDVTIEAESADHVVGAVTPCTDHWRVDNLSHSTALLIEDLEDPQQFIRVPGQRRRVVIPFELAKVTVAGPDELPLLTVFGPEPVVTPHAAHSCPGEGKQSAAHHRLDSGTRYFAVLRALCESQHAGPGHPVPTSETIAERVAEWGFRLTARAVDHHIDYLVQRLRLRPAAGPVQRSWKKEVLVSVALRRGLLDVPPETGPSRVRPLSSSAGHDEDSGSRGTTVPC